MGLGFLTRISPSLLVDSRVYFEKYKTFSGRRTKLPQCRTWFSLPELENSYQDSRKDKDEGSEDLLVPNLNHATDDASEPSEGDEE